MGYAITSLYSEGTWVPSWTGFSSNPTNPNAHYVRNGKQCTLKIRPTGGTSNATTMTCTLPFNGGGAGSQVFEVVVVNNGALVAGRMDIPQGSNIATFYSSAAGGAFINPGTKNVFVLITYITE